MPLDDRLVGLSVRAYLSRPKPNASARDCDGKDWRTRAVPGVAGGSALGNHSGGRSALASVSSRLLRGADSVFSCTHAHLGNVCCMLFLVTHPGRQDLSLTTEETDSVWETGPRLRHLWKFKRRVSRLLLLAPVYNAVFPVDSLALPFISLLCPSSL